MTDIDLIKQALEYLEDNQHHIADNERHAYVMLYNDFIAALKERLAQDKALQALHNENERLGLYKDAYAEQEPVELPCCGYTDASAVKWNPFNGVVQCHNCGQCYTTPPQRTEQEADELTIAYMSGLYDGKKKRTWVGLCAEWANEELKEKNTQQRTEQNFCSRCGKRTPDLITIHTCTPPQDNT